MQDYINQYEDLYSGLKVVAITGPYKSLVGIVDSIKLASSKDEENYILVNFTPTYNFKLTHAHLLDSSLVYVKMYIDELVFFFNEKDNPNKGVDIYGYTYHYYDIINPNYIKMPSYIDEPRDILLALLTSYDAYIIDNTDRLSEGWVPVCIDEYYNNEFREELDEIYYGNPQE